MKTMAFEEVKSKEEVDNKEVNGKGEAYAHKEVDDKVDAK